MYQVGRDRVLAAMNGNPNDLSGTIYGTTDGMPSRNATLRFPPRFARTTDGSGWRPRAASPSSIRC